MGQENRNECDRQIVTDAPAIEGLIGQRICSLKELAHTILGQVEVLRSAEAQAAALSINFSEAVRNFEIELIRYALLHTNGHQRRAAQLLGLNATTLNEKIKRYEIRARAMKATAKLRRFPTLGGRLRIVGPEGQRLNPESQG